jgi:hypothetical protein
MWNETVKANCSRDSSNADKSIALSFRHRVTDRTRTRRKAPSTVQSRMRSRKRILDSQGRDLDKPTRVRRGDLLGRNLTIWIAAVYCAPVVANAVKVSSR